MFDLITVLMYYKNIITLLQCTVRSLSMPPGLAYMLLRLSIVYHMLIANLLEFHDDDDDDDVDTW